jgi:acyl carrier protein
MSDVHSTSAVVPNELAIRDVIASCCGASIQECVLDCHIFDLGIDSLGLAAMVEKCATKWTLVFDDEAMRQLMTAQTVGDVVRLVKSWARV